MLSVPDISMIKKRFNSFFIMNKYIVFVKIIIDGRFNLIFAEYGTWEEAIIAFNYEKNKNECFIIDMETHDVMRSSL